MGEDDGNITPPSKHCLDGGNRELDVHALLDRTRPWIVARITKWSEPGNNHFRSLSPPSEELPLIRGMTARVVIRRGHAAKNLDRNEPGRRASFVGRSQ